MAPENFGYVPDRDEIEIYAESLPKKYGDDVAQLITEDDGRDVLLYRAVVYCLQKLSGEVQKQWLIKDGNFTRLKSYSQGSIGSCVGNAEGMVLSTEICVDILSRGEPDVFEAMVSAEACYAIGREVGGMLGGGDGSYGSAMAKGSVSMGTLLQLIYGEYDLRKYSVSTCRSWGRYGIPDGLKEEASQHKLKSSYRLKSAEEAWALVGAGHPINQCSNLGFSSTRNSDGVARQTGSWAHSMAINGRRTTKAGNKLFLITNSWGDDWISGPLFEDQPPGSFYAEWSAVERAISQGDVFVKVDMNGLKKKNMDWANW